MTTHVITLWRIQVTSLATPVSTMRSRIFEIIFVFKSIKRFKGSYDKQNLTLVVIAYEIYETSLRRVSSISYKMTLSVRPSICNI